MKKFKLKSGNIPKFKQMGSSPLKQNGKDRLVESKKMEEVGFKPGAGTGFKVQGTKLLKGGKKPTHTEFKGGYTFDDAFSTARKGGFKTFDWKGEKYHTRTKEEEATSKKGLFKKTYTKLKPIEKGAKGISTYDFDDTMATDMHGERDFSEHNIAARKTEGTIAQQAARRKKKALGRAPHATTSHSWRDVDPDAPGFPGSLEYEPPVKRSDLDEKGKAIWDSHRKSKKANK